MACHGPQIIIKVCQEWIPLAFQYYLMNLLEAIYLPKYQKIIVNIVPNYKAMWENIIQNITWK